MASLPAAARRAIATLAAILIASACATVERSPTTEPSPGAVTDDECAHVVDATVRADFYGTYTVQATVQSADTGWDKYADVWEVLDDSGTVLATRVLAHPHENEQPFTRSLSNVEIPGGTEKVSIRARDSVEGFCGADFEVSLQSSDRENSE